MKRPIRFAAFLAFLTLTSGCSAAEHRPPASPARDIAPAAVAPTPAPVPAPVHQSPAEGPAPGTAKAKNAGPTTRAAVVIYQGDVKMMTDEDSIPKTIDRIVDIAEQAGGHISARKDLSVQVKVPSAQFRETLSKIDELGGVTSRSVQADDVSEEFHDLEVRLTNLRATRTRLQEFMTKATNVNEMLVVERELERIAQEIDRIEGRLEYLRTRAAMSTISVAFTPKPKVTPVAAAPTPPLRTVDIPIPWMNDVSLDHVLVLTK
jgi:hypothetical protein